MTTFLGINMHDNVELTEARIFVPFEDLINWAYDESFCDIEELHDNVGIKMGTKNILERKKVVQAGLYDFDMSDYDDIIHFAHLSGGVYKRMNELEFEACAKVAGLGMVRTPMAGIGGGIPVPTPTFSEDESSPSPLSVTLNMGEWLEELDCWEAELEDELNNCSDDGRQEALEEAIKERDRKATKALASSSTSSSGEISEIPTEETILREAVKTLTGEKTVKKSRNFVKGKNVWYPADGGSFNEGVCAAIGKHQITIQTSAGKIITRDKMACYVIES